MTYILDDVVKCKPAHKLEVEMKCLVVSQFLNQYMTMARTDLVDEYKVSICKA